MATRLKEDFRAGEVILANYMNASNKRINENSDTLAYQKTKIASVEELLNAADLHGGEAQDADQIRCSVSGLASLNTNAALGELAKEVFPLTVSIPNSNAGTREVSDVNHKTTPVIHLAITRHGVDISAQATVSVSPDDGSISDHNTTYTGADIYENSKTYYINVTHNGQTKQVSAQWKFMNYLYAGDIGTSTLADATAVKNKIESSWRDSNKSLSEATTKDSTPLAAGHYYLFAVKGGINLVVRDAATNGVITGCASGSGLSIARVNGTGNDNYSWIIVPASSLSWNFKITNS